MTFTVSTQIINGETRYKIVTHQNVKYDTRTPEAALEIIGGLLENKRESHEAITRRPEPKADCAMLAISPLGHQF